MDYRDTLMQMVRAYEQHNLGNEESAIQTFKNIITTLHAQESTQETDWIIDTLTDAITGSQDQEPTQTNTGNEPISELITDWPQKFRTQEIPNVKLSDIIGLDNVKTELKNLIDLPITNPKAFDSVGFSTGILLYGPPGTGKTMLAAALANEFDCNFLNVHANDLLGVYVGQSEKSIRSLFETAQEYASRRPTLLFFDEIDTLLGKSDFSHGYESRIKSQFLTAMDGFDSKGSAYPLFVIGATNKPDFFEANQSRRFEEKLYVNLPDQQTLAKLFKRYLAGIPVISADQPNQTQPQNRFLYTVNPEFLKQMEQYEDTDVFGTLARIFTNYSPAEIVTVCRKATRLYLDENRNLTLVDFGQIRNEIPRAVTDAELDMYDAFSDTSSHKETENEKLEKELIRRSGGQLTRSDRMRFKLNPEPYFQIPKKSNPKHNISRSR